jgi:hypothetical protein
MVYLGPGWSTPKSCRREAISGLGWAKVSRPRSEDDVLRDAVAGLFGDEILDKASTGHDCCSVAAGGPRVLVRTLPPAVVRPRQPQAVLFFEHMRQRIDLDMQGSPQGDPHRCAIWCRTSLTMHGAFPRILLFLWLLRGWQRGFHCELPAVGIAEQHL